MIQEINPVKSFYFVGDDRVKKSIYLDNILTTTINALPINDCATKKMLQTHKDSNIIFFSCGYPLMGCQEIDTIKKLQNVEVEKRLIPYRHKPASRGFYNNDWWKNLSEDDISFLFDNWETMLSYYYQQYDQIVFLPLAAHYFDKILNLSNKAMSIIFKFEGVVDLSPLDNFQQENYQDKYGNLSKLGFTQIEFNIREWMSM